MPYEVFARKWRPQLLEEVSGQEHITRTLRNSLLSDRVAHAYIFSGPRGVGKTSVARIFAKALNCRKMENGNPCNKCTSCVGITNGSSIDVQEIDGASNRGIDEIRSLRESSRYLPSSSKYKIYIIDEVHMLTLQAFNALLKTLEEPPPHVKFIFATTESHKVPVTILSRCQRFDFKRIPLFKIEEQIKRILEEEKIKISDTGISIIAKEAEGSMRDAESLLDQVVSSTGSDVMDSDIIEVLGVIDREIIFQMSRAIIEGNGRVCIEIIDKIYNFGYDAKEFYNEIMGQFRNLIVSLISQDTSRILDLPDNELEETKIQAKEAGMERLLQSLNFLISREADLRYTNNPRIALETILIKLSTLKDYLSFDELIKKIKDLEKSLDGNIIVQPDIPGPAPAVPRKDEKQVNEKAPGVADFKKNWNEFINYVASKSRSMAAVLKESVYHVTGENKIELSVGGKPFTKTYFDDSSRYDRFVGCLSDFFHTDIKAVIKKQDGFEGLKGDDSGKEKFPAPVQDIIEIFEGKIV